MGIYTISVQGSFDAAHHLTNYVGACAAVHGHRWTVQTYYKVDTAFVALDPAGITLDLKALKQALHEVIDPLDHTDLNTSFHFTSAESLAKHIYRALQQAAYGHYLTKVKVEETPGCWVSYEEHGKDENEDSQD